MNEQEYIDRLKTENKILQDKLDKIDDKRKKKRKFKWWLLKKSSVPILGSRLKRSINDAIHEYKEYKTVSVDTVSDVSSSIIWRITRIGLFAFFFAVLPSTILVIQTLLLKNQNELVHNQTDLVESQRRSSLVFVMDNVLSDLNEELKYKGVNSKNNISNTLQARIVSLSLAMQPYKYKEGEKLIDKKISPERGQLLYSLIKSDLGQQSLSDIFYAGDFEYSSLREVSLGRGVYLKYAKLNHSNLYKANMPAANLASSELKEVDMSYINLSDANLSRARLIEANVKNAEMAGIDLTNANLSGADFTGADLSEAKLWGAKIVDANFTDTVLDNVIVDRQDWIDYINDTLDLKGASDIKDKYRVKKQGKQQFVLVPKKG
ncbi:pentapeptide repeat-containing protein [Aquimarina sp. D1M17]|uniref:pentapeptide repeat-containing protein n=1 Tax=Aquimarina acroporae TaxID=2937283 RepID=UPI0020BD57F6|nr:pentapeptide repeat-containing protein [Aquimarina acroporae]MCK8522349.1 pentapeptide repeat-containing protein [Aquimarina acroporae]